VDGLGWLVVCGFGEGVRYSIGFLWDRGVEVVCGDLLLLWRMDECADYRFFVQDS